MIAEEIHGYLEQENLLPKGQKGYRQGSHRTKDQWLIYRTVLKDCKKGTPVYLWHG